ncbi:NifB/NifX family molybdenum-iron cluster-binding protein [Zooshikella sp. RANM57]|uniref:NifB/NifX family molybdenum-iron cluster-binding protein n=1 Tax=Zooshikella sp. RANM57 TaxID=3425863 RepID=UPI003D6E5C2F
MIAVPLNNQKNISGHFSKAPQFLIYDPTTKAIQYLLNHSSQASCQNKHNLIKQLQTTGVTTICVHNIGQHMLDRLLKNGFLIHRMGKATKKIHAVLTELHHSPCFLTSAQQGKPSKNHELKHTERQCHCHQTRFCCDKKCQ